MPNPVSQQQAPSEDAANILLQPLAQQPALSVSSGSTLQAHTGVAETFASVTARNNELVKAVSTTSPLTSFNSHFGTSNSTRQPLASLRGPHPEQDVTLQGLISIKKTRPRTVGDIGSDDIFWVNSNDQTMTRKLLEGIVAYNEITTDGLGGAHSSATGPNNIALLTAMFDKNGGDVAATVADTATRMTNRIREAIGSETVRGLTAKATTIITVQWYWLISMGSMVVLRVLFFVTAVVFSNEKNRVIWKSSSLAVSYHGLDGFAPAELDDQSITDMRSGARTLEAKLEVNDEGFLRLIRQ